MITIPNSEIKQAPLYAQLNFNKSLELNAQMVHC